MKASKQKNNVLGCREDRVEAPVKHRSLVRPLLSAARRALEQVWFTAADLQPPLPPKEAGCSFHDPNARPAPPCFAQDVPIHDAWGSISSPQGLNFASYPPCRDPQPPHPELSPIVSGVNVSFPARAKRSVG